MSHVVWGEDGSGFSIYNPSETRLFGDSTILGCYHISMAPRIATAGEDESFKNWYPLLPAYLPLPGNDPQTSAGSPLARMSHMAPTYLQGKLEIQRITVICGDIAVSANTTLLLMRLLNFIE